MHMVFIYTHIMFSGVYSKQKRSHARRACRMASLDVLGGWFR